MTQISLDLGPEEGDDTLGVRQLTDAINQALRRGFREGVWVRGEIEDFSVRNGHVYFTLAERSEEGRAVVSVALFANVALRLRPLLARHRLRLTNGLAVRLHANLDLYAPTGRLTLKMDGLDPAFTLGALAASRDQLLRALAEDGVLGANAARPFPAVPLEIALITSRGSAAWHDVMDELNRSGLGFRVLAIDTRVQGEGAARLITGALAAAARSHAQVVLLVRGGGSKADLATFDDERMARAIAACPIPVLTGLGHEIDRSVADEVAHRAYKTPTACAHALVGAVSGYLEQAEAAWERVAVRAAASVTHADRRLATLAHRGAQCTNAGLNLAGQRLDHAAARVRREAMGAVVNAGSRLERDAGRVDGAARRATVAAGLLVDGIDARVRALDPARALARGWSITRRADGTIVRDGASLQPGDVLETTFATGQATSRVEAAS
jgi:exodeoxyribonuclease VII large subunit